MPLISQLDLLNPQSAIRESAVFSRQSAIDR